MDLYKDARCYYSHSMQNYDTDQEKQESDFLKSVFGKIICPNKDLGRSTNGMKAYLKVIEWADIIAVSEYKGAVGCGVFTEVKRALDLSIPVLCIRDRKLIKVVDVILDHPLDIKITYGQLVLEE